MRWDTRYMRVCPYTPLSAIAPPAATRGVTLHYEVPVPYIDPGTGEGWYHYPRSDTAAWAFRALDGTPLYPAWQRQWDAHRVQRVLATGAVSGGAVWTLLAEHFRAHL